MSRKHSRKRRKSKSKPKPKLSYAQRLSGVSATLHETRKLLRDGNYDRALAVIGNAESRCSKPEEHEAVQRLKAETYLQMALTQDNAHLRLQQIDAALNLMPNAPRLRFYRGLTLWRMGKQHEACKEFDAVAADKPDWLGITYLCQLGRLAQGLSWQPMGLSEAEANTLHLVQDIANPPQHAPSTALQIDLPQLGDVPELWQTLSDLKHGSHAGSLEQLERAVQKAENQEIVAITNYYVGVAALHDGDTNTAQGAWLKARAAGLATPWFNDNFFALQRLLVIDLATHERWTDIVAIADDVGEVDQMDKILAESFALAYNHIGNESARQGLWAKAADHWEKAFDHAGDRQIAQNLALAKEALQDWGQAAEAWRDMIRRRPRKQSHTEYLDDNQVAALWHHTATCYQRAEQLEEAITCLKHASKYAGDDIDIRLELVDSLLYNDQYEAAENELERVLTLEPDHIEALKRRAMLLMAWGGWPQEAITIWKRILALAPDDVEAQEGLADAHINMADFSSRMPESQRISYLETALEDLPGHPSVSIKLAMAYRYDGQSEKAVEVMRQSFYAHPLDSRAAGSILHELLHIDDDEDVVEEIILQIHKIDSLLPGFWFEQINQILYCELEEYWIERFVDEAIALTERPYVRYTQASILAEVCEIFYEQDEIDHILRFRDRLRIEAPQSGAVEFVEARLAEEKQDFRKAQRLLKTARRLARRTGDPELVRLIEECRVGYELDSSNMPDDLLLRLMELFPDGPPSSEDLEAYFDD